MAGTDSFGQFEQLARVLRMRHELPIVIRSPDSVSASYRTAPRRQCTRALAEAGRRVTPKSARNHSSPQGYLGNHCTRGHRYMDSGALRDAKVWNGHALGGSGSFITDIEARLMPAQRNAGHDE